MLEGRAPHFLSRVPAPSPALTQTLADADQSRHNSEDGPAAKGPQETGGAPTTVYRADPGEAGETAAAAEI